MTTNPDIATEARRIASERVPPTTHPTPWWEIARQDAERKLRRGPSWWRRLIARKAKPPQPVDRGG
jgi:hypothetical protein